MRFSKLKMILASLVAVFAFSGCTPQEQALIANSLAGNTGSSYGNSYYYNGHNYGYNRDAYYQNGVRDGCKSRQRGYTVKNRYRWNNYSSYRSGWYAGKRQCRKSYDHRNYYNKGYNDGCWSKRYRGIKKNRNLYNNNRKYRNGWKNGYSNCNRRY